MNESQHPIFVLSLPRSGSTLLQRLLAAHPDIATTSEPWILLPYLYTLRRAGVYGEYGHRSMVRAIEDFAGRLDGGAERYRREVGELVLRLYAAASNGEAYFVDKTPRYHLVVDEVMDMFPEGRFIFLWRQPLAVAASMIESFGRGAWNLDKYSADLHGGLERLIQAEDRADRQILHLNYEDIVAAPQREVGRALEWLELSSTPDVLSLADRPVGRMGDRTGVVKYANGVTSEPLDKWKTTFGTAYRRRWARRYLDWVGPARIERMGYDFDRLRDEVDALGRSRRRVASDVARSVYERSATKVAHRLTHPSAAERRRQAALAEANAVQSADVAPPDAVASK